MNMSKPPPKSSVKVRPAIVQGEPSVVLTVGDDEGAALVFSADEAAQVIVSMTNAIKTLAALGGSRAD